jgi:uroporphyrinogen decarboxylase
LVGRFGTSAIDEFGIRWDTSDQAHAIGDWGSILAYPLPEPTLAGYHFPDGDDPRRFSGFDSEALKAQNRFVILSITGLFDLCWHLRGFENFMMDMASGDDFADALLNRALQYALELVAAIPEGVDGVRVGEDWGLQKGLITGAALWRRLLKPRLKILYGAIRARGLRLFIHSCGDIAELFPDIIEMGVEVVHPIQPEAMDVARLQREYGRDIAMYGGIGTQSTLVFGTPEDVVAEAEERLTTFREGGYILGPAGAISTDAKIENVIALADFAISL